MKRIGLVVPVLNNFEGLTVLLESVKVPSWASFHPFIIDNWRENRGVAAGWNLGIGQAIKARCDYILVCNDDVALSANVFPVLANTLDNVDDCVVATGWNVRDHKTIAQVSRRYFHDQTAMCAENPDFSCFMITPETIDEVGWFDTNLWPAYFEDNDYHYRVKLAGKRALSVSSAEMIHVGSVTQNKNPLFPVVPAPQFIKNREYYASKWGGVPGEETYTSPFNRPHWNWKLF